MDEEFKRDYSDACDLCRPILQVENLHFGMEKSALCEPVSFDLFPGRTLWIQGRSGAGKTTLLKTLARLVAPLDGKMKFKGVNWREIEPFHWRAALMYVPQRTLNYSETVRTTLLRPFGLKIRKSRESPPGNLEEVLEDFLVPAEVLEKQIGALSVGQAGRIALIRALLCNPSALLIDEVSAALDHKSRTKVAEKLGQWLTQGDRCILGVSHDVSFIDSLPGDALHLRSTDHEQEQLEQ
jgi:ABC-type iron transport system FetAB ATPase subunit